VQRREVRHDPRDAPARPADAPVATAAPDAHTLPNGLRVLTLPDRRAPVVEFRLVLPFAGRAYDDPDWVGLASATARLMIAGTPTRTSFEIADEADRYGGSIGVSANTETATLSARCLSPYLEPMTRLIADVLLHPTFPPDEVEIDRANTLQRLRLQRSQPAFWRRSGSASRCSGRTHTPVLRPTKTPCNAGARTNCRRSTRRATALPKRRCWWWATLTPTRF
jgi:hypothetical protein